MMKAKVTPLSFWTIILALLALNIIAFSVLIVTAANDLKVQYTPDDIDAVDEPH